MAQVGGEEEINEAISARNNITLGLIHFATRLRMPVSRNFKLHSILRVLEIITSISEDPGAQRTGTRYVLLTLRIFVGC